MDVKLKGDANWATGRKHEIASSFFKLQRINLIAAMDLHREYMITQEHAKF